jgi:hypothetical protein
LVQEVRTGEHGFGGGPRRGIVFAPDAGTGSRAARCIPKWWTWAGVAFRVPVGSTSYPQSESPRFRHRQFRAARVRRGGRVDGTGRRLNLVGPVGKDWNRLGMARRVGEVWRLERRGVV